MIYDLAIIGGGPAGVAAGVYASRKRLKTIFLTKDFNGQSVDSAGIENWIGTVNIPGPELSKNLEKHIRAYATDKTTGEVIVDIKTGELCQLISKSAETNVAITKTAVAKNGTFTITTSKGSYEARTVLMTAGSHRRKLAVPGADKYEHKGLTYCASCDGPIYAGQDVVVVGGGNAGFESAAQLLAYCKSVTLLNRSGNLRADPSTIASVTAQPQMKLVMNAIPKEVKGDKFVTSIVYTDMTGVNPKNLKANAAGKDIELPVTGIFVEIGSIPTTEFAKDLIKLDEFNRVIADPRTQRTSVDGIWAAGDCTDGLYHQNNIATGDAIKALEDIYIWVQKNRNNK